MKSVMNNIVVTGFATITAAGVGIKPLIELLENGASALTPAPLLSTNGETYLWGKADAFKATEFIPPMKARKMDRCSQIAVATAGLALKDARIDKSTVAPERIGIALGCGFGGINNSVEFMSGFFQNGIEGAAPLLFPNTVANSPASNASIEHALKGPNVTTVQRFCSAESAMLMACDFIADGRADIMLAGGVDDLIAMMLKGFMATKQAKSHASSFGEGAGIIVLESAAHAAKRAATVKARLVDISSVGTLLQGMEQAGINRLIEDNIPADTVVSISGVTPKNRELSARIANYSKCSIEHAVGRSLAMGGTSVAALLATLKKDQPAIHLSVSPEGPYYALRFIGGGTSA